MKTARIIPVALLILLTAAIASGAGAPAGGPGGVVKSLPNVDTPGGGGKGI